MRHEQVHELFRSLLNTWTREMMIDKALPDETHNATSGTEDTTDAAAHRAGKWAKPQVIDGLTVSFGPRDIGTLLPPMSEIPAPFKHGNQWTDMVGNWFFSGIPKDAIIEAADGIDQSDALRHLKACLGSFQPQHEHKTAGVAYLMSLWFTQFGKAKR